MRFKTYAVELHTRNTSGLHDEATVSRDCVSRGAPGSSRATRTQSPKHRTLRIVGRAAGGVGSSTAYVLKRITTGAK